MLKMRIVQDQDLSNPREFDENWSLACAHRRHTLGDQDHILGTDWESWKSQLEKMGAFFRPVYMMDHSALTFKMEPFGGDYGRFDSGWVGFIFATREQLEKYKGWKKLTAARIKILLKEFQNELECYQAYVNGWGYGYQVVDIDPDENLDDEKNGEILESCYGYYEEDYCRQEGESMLATRKKQEEESAWVHAAQSNLVAATA